jgi:hypothetical protein
VRARAAARVAAILASVLACGVLTCGVLATSALATTPASGLGVNGWYLLWVMPQSQWDAQLAAMAADDVKVVRADAFWSSVEPAKPTGSTHRYNWSATDAIVGALARHGMQWLPIADYSAPWAESAAGNEKSAPGDVASYAAFAAALVTRYGSSGSFWKANPGLTPQPISAVEIWNEENLSGTYVAPASYATLYEAARAAIHDVNPSVEAIVGGLGNPADQYIDQMYSALGGPGKIDAVADHPYDLTPADTIADVKKLRLALDTHGDANVPIDMTEFGWPTEGSASWTQDQSDSQRAADLTQVINALGSSDCGVQRILPYSWVTAQDNPGDTGDWFGLANLSGAADQSTAALANAYAALAGAASAGSATTSVCGRPLSLQMTEVPPPTGGGGNLCVRATVLSWSSAGSATVGISDATIAFTSPAKVSLRTNASGQATACWNVPKGADESIAANAAQPNFSPKPTSSLQAAASTEPVTDAGSPVTPAPAHAVAPPPAHGVTPATEPPAPHATARSKQPRRRHAAHKHRRRRRRRRRRSRHRRRVTRHRRS